MSAFFESRMSDSPYIQIIWRGHVEQDYSPVCPADSHWNLLFTRRGSRIRVTAEGATTQFIPKDQFEGSEFLVIKFAHGVFMPNLPPDGLVNVDAVLPEATGNAFWLHGSVWQLPDFNNVETFVDRMVRDGLLVHDPVVPTVLQDQSPDVSLRTVRRRFLRATGLTHGEIRQIERAQQAAMLLEQGAPILDAVFAVGYADQPHLTRSLKRFYGQTPAQIVRPAAVVAAS